MSKAGLVVVGFKKFQSLPERKIVFEFDKIYKFEKGLSEFFVNTMRRSYVAFKDELEEGQSMKKRAVIQLINTTMGGQKKLFNRWINLTEKSRLLNECRLVSKLFTTLNFAIKSVSDNAFNENIDNSLKEKALIQLFKNLSSNMSDCLRRWRDVNIIEKLKENLTQHQKEAVLKVL